MSESVRPAETFAFVGHEAAEAALAESLKGGRMHHAWLIAGPKGVGKATLAFRFARVALGARVIGPRPFDVAPDDSVARRIAANAHPDFFLLERRLNERGRLRRDISAEEARKAAGFFALAPAEGGRRVAIVDAVDELNRFGANALLKTLEEPPENAILLLVCHAPGAALPTIRSRCRRLDLRPLTAAQMTHVLGEVDSDTLRLAGGRPGRAHALMASGKGAAALARDIAAALSRLEREGGRALLELAASRGGEERLSLTLDAVEDWIRRAVAAAEGAPLGDAPAVARENAARWAEAYSALEALRSEAEDLDLDPDQGLAQAALILDRAAAKRT